ncbi:MAG: DUF1963 domain-containing protein [Acidimicrobiales bacterium]
MGRDEIARRLLSAAPGAGSRLADNLLPAVRYATRPEPDAAIDVGQSKFGGAADLPVGTPWPSWTKPDGQRRTLQFFAQLDLAEAAAAAPADLGLRTEGQLSFFADFGVDDDGILGLYPWEREGSTVLYSPPDVQLARCSLRMAPLCSAQLLPLSAWTWPTPSIAGVEVTDAEYETLDALDQELHAGLGAALPEHWNVTGRHQLGGHARYIQHPVEEEVVQAVAGCFTGGGFDSAAWERSRPAVREWRMVLQLDSDDTLEAMWGDVGTIWWAARYDDIAARRWDAGMFNFQCS